MSLPRTIEAIDADVAIVGAGPAGCALATELGRRRLRVALLDRRTTPAFRVGETLPPNVGTRLRRLGLWSSFLALHPTPLYGVLTAWGQGTPEAHSYFGHPEGCGWVVDRAAFDTMLCKAAVEAGAVLVAPMRLGDIARGGEGGWTVQGATAEGGLIARARIVVDASGRGAACAVRIGARIRRLDRLIGLVWRLERHGPAEPTLVEATPNGWWYTAAVPGGRMVVVFMTEVDVARHHQPAARRRWPPPFLSEAPLTAERVRDSRPQDVPLVFAAYTQTLEPAAGDGWLAVGDAAIGRDPISGSGIDFALASSEIAAEAIVRACGGDRSATSVYADLIRRDFVAYLEERRSVYAAERRWPHARFWQLRNEHPTWTPALALS